MFLIEYDVIVTFGSLVLILVLFFPIYEYNNNTSMNICQEREANEAYVKKLL